jgi:glycosyltransferase involved in cell wall biosynthesis
MHWIGFVNLHQFRTTFRCMKPEVSIVMPTHNASATLDEAVCSILDQTWQDFEFIIVDDGSSDDTLHKLERYARLDSRVKLYRQRKEGMIAALNRGCRQARADYIARMDADDISLPRRIERQREFLERHPEIGIVGTWASRMDEKGSIIGEWCPSPNPQVLKWGHFFGCCVIHPSVLMRRQILEVLEFYKVDAVHAEDRDLWLRASAITEFSNIPEILLKYRVWHKSTSKRLRQEYVDNAIKLGVFFISDFLKDNTSIEAVAGLRGTTLANLGQIRLTAALLERIYHAFVAENSLSSQDRKEISWDAAKKMGSLALQASRFSGLEFLLLLARALQLNYRILSVSAILKALERRRAWDPAGSNLRRL